MDDSEFVASSDSHSECGSEYQAHFVDFDLHSILEYAYATAPIIPSSQENSQDSDEYSSSSECKSGEFTITARKYVTKLSSPVPIIVAEISRYAGRGVSETRSGTYKMKINQFDFKNSIPGESSLTIMKKQKARIKKGVLFSMHILSADVESEISTEINFIITMMKKCRQHFNVSKMKLELDLCPESHTVTISLSYRIEIVVSFYRYFSSDVSQAFNNMLYSNIEKISELESDLVTNYAAMPQDNHLFYKIMTDKTSRMPPSTRSYAHPDLKTSLLPFQRKSVDWLFSKEGVEFDEQILQSRAIPVISRDLQKALIDYPETNRDWLSKQIFIVFSRLCFGWRRCLLNGKISWFNKFTGNIMSEYHAVEFLRAYHNKNSITPLPGCGLLSEEMGLGKTVEITTLIKLNPRPVRDAGSSISLQLKKGGDFRLMKKAKTTLIAAPESILRQWYSEICQICPTLSVTIYKGSGRYPELGNIPQYISEFLQSYDIVLLNYSTLSKELDYANYSSRHKPTRGGQKRNRDSDIISRNSEDTKNTVESSTEALRSTESSEQMSFLSSQKQFEKSLLLKLAQKVSKTEARSIPYTQFYESPLMSCQWWRVVLDEVQMVSSGSTRAFATASILPRFHSWGVSGTPSMSPAVLQFLRFSPFDYDNHKFCWNLLNSLTEGNADFVELWSSLAIRHTKSMVHDDIKLPPQSRVLLMIPFTEVEQDKYKEVLESALAYVGAHDMKSFSRNKNTLDGTGYSHLRFWLFKLRQLCGNLQVGKLPKIRNSKGLDATKLLTTGAQELKTLDVVLSEMIEGVHDEISECEKALVNRILDICSALEYKFFPEKVVEVLNMILPQIQRLMDSAAHKNRVDITQFRQTGAWLMERDSLPVEYTGETFAINGSSVSQAEISPKAENFEKNRIEQQENQLHPEFKDTKIYETLADFRKKGDRMKLYQIKFRSWKLIQHKCFFLLASAHFQLDDPKYQRRIKQFKNSLEAASHLVESIKNLCFFENQSESSTKPKSDYIYAPHSEMSLHPSSQEAFDESNKKLEEKYYGLAEECRREILKHSMSDVQKVIEIRMSSRTSISETGWVNDGSKSFPKSTKKLVKNLPTIDASLLTALVSSKRHIELADQFHHLSSMLNLQAEAINDCTNSLYVVLTNPLTNNNKDADGQEFDQSVQDQEKASCLMFVVLQMLEDRANAVSESGGTITELERQQENNFKQEAERSGDKSFLQDLQKTRLIVKPDVKISMEEVVEESKLLEVRSAKAAAHHLFSVDFFTVLKNIYENEKAAVSLLKKEINSSFNMVFNSRVEYFRQLQQISDSVQNNSFNFPQESADLTNLETLFQNLSRNMIASQNKLAKSIARSKYLSTLAFGAKLGEQEQHRNDIVCIICQSSITLGSLTLCGHRFCKSCLEEWLRRSPRCPICKTPTNADNVYGFTLHKSGVRAQQSIASAEARFEQDGWNKKELNQIYKSADEETLRAVQRFHLPNSYGSKVDLIVKQVLYLRDIDPEVQIVIFSQWQDLLFILAFAFEKIGISFVSARGSNVHSSRRNKLDPVEEFKDRTTIKTCFLLNAQAQSSGLTLINATHIFLCEPLINTSTELQAISRIHRIGQKKATTVWMFSIENSVEQNVVTLGLNRRVEYSQANSGRCETGNPDKMTNKDGKVLEESELRDAESFALTLETGSSKAFSVNSEFVDDSDLWKIYFGFD